LGRKGHLKTGSGKRSHKRKNPEKREKKKEAESEKKKTGKIARSGPAEHIVIDYGRGTKIGRRGTKLGSRPIHN